MDTLRTFR